MKITKRQLRQIIKEEKAKLLAESQNPAMVEIEHNTNLLFIMKKMFPIGSKRIQTRKFATLWNCTNKRSINPFTHKISVGILLTVCHTILMMLVWRIWSWIN